MEAFAKTAGTLDNLSWIFSIAQHTIEKIKTGQTFIRTASNTFALTTDIGTKGRDHIISEVDHILKEFRPCLR